METTEKVPGYESCHNCGKDVDEWNISFESTIHCEAGQYEKLHRCPHCNEICLEDQGSSLGCLVFFVWLFGAPVIVGLLDKSFHFLPNMSAELFVGINLALSFVVSGVVVKVWQWSQKT